MPCAVRARRGPAPNRSARSTPPSTGISIGRVIGCDSWRWVGKAAPTIRSEKPANASATCSRAYGGSGPNQLATRRPMLPMAKATRASSSTANAPVAFP